MSEAGEKLFGRTVAKATGEYMPSPDWLHARLEGEQSVARHFCRGCGLSEEVNAELARRYAEQVNSNLDEVTSSGVYIETAGCDLCDGDQSVVEVKKIQKQ